MRSTPRQAIVAAKERSLPFRKRASNPAWTACAGADAVCQAHGSTLCLELFCKYGAPQERAKARTPRCEHFPALKEVLQKGLRIWQELSGLPKKLGHGPVRRGGHI